MGVAGVISGRLAEGELVIIDGGMGSQLQAEGVPMMRLRGALARIWSGPMWCSPSTKHTSGLALR
jgi:hypothetical protein